MLKTIHTSTDPLLDLVRDDPVRPYLSKEFRVQNHRFVSAWHTDTVKAMCCVSLQDHIPSEETELNTGTDTCTHAVFYTIWSYEPGWAGVLLRATMEYITQNNPQVHTYVTLSPKTEMAKRFHLKNGARLLRQNHNTVNYEYRT